MKPRHAILAMAVAVGGAGPPVMAATDAPPMPTTAPVAVQIDPLVQAIRQAPDPSSVTQAYANARAANRDDLDLERAYVARMAELGLPEMADAQAQDLLRRDPNNALAWSVAAYMSAKRGQMSTALTSMAIAVQRSPDDPFVQRTAGQLVAFYDTKAGQQQVDDSARKAAETLRASLAGRAMYVDAYRSARESYAKEYAPATTQPSAQPGAVATAEGQAYPSTAQAPGTYNTYYSYPDPYAYTTAPYYYPASYYPGPYYGPGPWWPDGWAWWWPTFSAGFIFTSNDFHNHHDGDHHHHDGGDHHHSDFNHHNNQFHHGDFHDPPTRQAPPPRPADLRGSSMASHSVTRPPAASGGAGAVPRASASARPTGAPQAAALARPTGAPRVAAPARPTGVPHAAAAPHASPAGGMRSAPVSGGHGGMTRMGHGGGGGGGMSHGGGGGRH